MTSRARLVGLNHVALEVGDLEEALSFYGRIFEFELRGRVPGMAFIDIGDQFIALSEGPHPAAPTRTATSSTFAIRGATTCRSSSTGTFSSRRRPEC
jgi:catechol 2,3-dioxygenase-like lactoylglutathione lyase family enzyme